MEMRLPDFIVAGVRKCGSTWLHQCLSEHPQIYVPAMTKELFFFDRLWERGAGWYAGFFKAARPGQICGEATPSYFAHPEAPARIHATVPNAKLVFVFRNPIDRAVSMYHHMLSVGETRLPLREALEQFPALVEEGFYDRYYSRYADLFGDAALFPLVLEQARTAGDEALSPLFRFLGIDPSFRPPSLFERTYERRQARSGWLASIVGRSTMFLRDRGLHKIVNAAKAAGVPRLFYTKDAPKPEPVADDIYEQLKKAYLPDTSRLGERIGCDLVSLWKLEKFTRQ